MPKSSPQHSLHCQQAGDFTVVTSGNDINKENWNQTRNYQTVNQAIAQERLHLLRMVELENKIFTLAFLLIENFYRPTNIKIENSEATKNVPLQTKRKRHTKGEPMAVNASATNCDLGSEARPALGLLTLPRKRIHGLSKAYKAEYSAKMALSGISKRFGDFHRELLDWQLVFASASDSSSNGSNLAKELNYDSLFDYEDAIAATANLLSIARQHSNLINGLVLCPDSTSKSIYPEYIPDQANHGRSDEFQKLIVLVEQLIKVKQERAAQFSQRESGEKEQPGHSLVNWFMCDKSTCDDKPLSDCSQSTQFGAQNILREISAWEEFSDMVEITK